MTTDREARLAEQLRRNLQRRKAQARSRRNPRHDGEPSPQTDANDAGHPEPPDGKDDGPDRSLPE